MMRRTRKQLRMFRLGKVTIWFLVLSAFLFFTMSLSVALAMPSYSGQVAGDLIGGVTVGTTTTVNMGSSSQAVLNWDSLNTSPTEILQFIKTSGDFAVLNRVINGIPTQFDGHLIGNQGHIIIVNPRGIVFGPTSLIEARRFTASGIDILNDDFMGSVYRFEKNGLNPYADQIGNVTNEGTIQTQQLAALIGKNVFNNGTIAVNPGGYVILAAGESVYLSESGSNIVVDVAMANPAEHVVDNGGAEGTGSGKIGAEDAKVILAAGDIFSTALTGIESLRAEAKRDIFIKGDVTAGGPTSDDPSIIVNGGGNVTTSGFEVRGRDTGLIDVHADGHLVVNGDTSIKIQSNPEQEAATAEVLLTAGKSVVVNGDVDAEARGKNASFAHILIEAGQGASKGWDATINGNLDAWSHTAEHGTSYALIELYASGKVNLNGTEDPFAHAGEGNGRARVQGDFDIPDDEEGRDEIVEEGKKHTNTYVAEVIIDSRGLPYNQPPLAIDDLYSVDKDTILNIGVINGILTNDSDEDGDGITAILISGPAHGTLTLNPDGSFTYTPNPDFSGEDSFTYLASDGDSESNVATVRITVNAGGDGGNGGNGEVVFTLAAPLPELQTPQIGGCPALMNWLADELGVGREQIDIYIANVLAYSADLQPCDVCARLQGAARTLADGDGVRMAALAQVVNEFVTPGAPITEEQMALIAAALTQTGEGDTQYASAGEWLDALAAYVSILRSEMRLSADDAVALATDKYIAPATEGADINLAAFIRVRLESLGG